MKLKADILKSAIYDQPITPEEQLIDDKELSQLIGISVDSIRNSRREGKGIKHFKIGNSIRYRLGDVKKFLQNCEVKTKEQQ